MLSQTKNSPLSSSIQCLSDLNELQINLKRGRGRPKSLKTLVKEAEKAGHCFPPEITEALKMAFNSLQSQQRKSKKLIKQSSKANFNPSLIFDKKNHVPQKESRKIHCDQSLEDQSFQSSRASANKKDILKLIPNYHQQYRQQQQHEEYVQRLSKASENLKIMNPEQSGKPMRIFL